MTAHDKTYNKTCATRKDSEQSAHPRSLIIFFADCMCLLQPPGYPKWDKRVLAILGRCTGLSESLLVIHPASILYKSIAGRYRPVSYPDGPITVRYRFIKNAYLAGLIVGFVVCWLIND